MTENDRNKTHAELYTRMIKEAFGKDAAIIIGHHLTFENNGDLNTENEIPSADTLLFDHYAMTQIFGVDALALMRLLASVPIEERDALVIAAYYRKDNPCPGCMVAGEDYTTKQWILEQEMERVH